jgi:hypothetical protein
LFPALAELNFAKWFGGGARQSASSSFTNDLYLAEGASNEPARQRYKRMEAAWRSLADEQDWLDGERSPDGKSDE